MKTRSNELNERELELVKLLMSECESTRDIQEKLKRLFGGTIEQMLEAEMEEHLGFPSSPMATACDISHVLPGMMASFRATSKANQVSIFAKISWA